MQSYAIESRHLVQYNAKWKILIFPATSYSAYEIKVNKRQTYVIMFQSAATKKSLGSIKSISV